MENKNMLFGLRPIIEAIEAGRQIEKVYLKKGADGVLLGRAGRTVPAAPDPGAVGPGRKAEPARAG